MRKLILASASPRRREILETAGIAFEVMASHADEETNLTDPEEIVQKLSQIKCLDVLGKTAPGELVLGADTIVVLDGEILGKPSDPADARQMLRHLQGRRHDVYTGVTIAQRLTDGSTKQKSFSVQTEVAVSPLTDEEIDAYIATGEPLDKAGAYGIQGLFCRHVEEIRGDYYNVVGLPVHAVYQELKNW
ncbi:MAG: septum formation inhibitor Maf [Eubacterium sp.]|nr:septum formation inhibitor Maf [Eubacterium sp.]